jgi:hypothetical protein
MIPIVGITRMSIFSMPQASSRQLFMKKGSQDIICNIPKIENGVERDAAIKKAKFKRKRWIIEALVRQDVKVKEKNLEWLKQRCCLRLK